MLHVNTDDLDWNEYDQDGHEFRRKELANAAESEQLGCSRYELPPGGREERSFEGYFPLDGDVDYWERESEP